MPISQRLYRLIGIPLLSAALMVLLLLSAASAWLIGQNRIYADSVSHTEKVLNRISRLHTEIRTIESSQRGFLLTHDPAYLAAYDLTRLEIDPSIDKLHALVADNTAETERVDQLRQAADLKQAELVETIADAKAGSFDQALSLVQTGRGLRAMKDLEGLFNAMTAAENQSLTDRALDYDRANTTARWLNISGTAATLFLAAGFWFMTSRYLSAIRAAQRLLANLNAGLEQRVQERTAALQRANEEVQRFAYIVSHDLRSPLVNIMGFTSELDAARVSMKNWLSSVEERNGLCIDPAVRQAVDEELPEAIGFIRGSAQKMDRLIKAILQISREGGRVLAPEAIDLDTMVQGIRASLTTMLETRGAEMIVERLPALIGDRLSVEQLLSNLLENAVKYLAPERKGRIVVDGEAAGAFVEIRVTDNGRGIDARDMERIFELFRRAGPQDQPGEGIGLANVRAQATRLGGSVTCRSELNVGSTFTLILPRVLQIKAQQEKA